jgi:hypothetical protein
MLLARIMVAKVANSAQLYPIHSNVPLIYDDPAWTCRIWVGNAIVVLEAAGKSLGARQTSWATIE